MLVTVCMCVSYCLCVSACYYMSVNLCVHDCVCHFVFEFFSVFVWLCVCFVTFCVCVTVIYPGCLYYPRYLSDFRSINLILISSKSAFSFSPLCHTYWEGGKGFWQTEFRSFCFSMALSKNIFEHQIIGFEMFIAEAERIDWMVWWNNLIFLIYRNRAWGQGLHGELK